MTRRSPLRVAHLARPQHREAFERYQKTLATALCVLIGLMALNVVSCVLSAASRHFR